MVDPRCKPVEPRRLMLFTCPDCGRDYGRGKGKYGIALHACLPKDIYELRRTLRQLLTAQRRRQDLANGRSTGSGVPLELLTVTWTELDTLLRALDELDRLPEDRR